jgi:hypothetical protein
MLNLVHGGSMQGALAHAAPVAPVAAQPPEEPLSVEMLQQLVERLTLKNKSLETVNMTLRSAVSGATCRPAVDKMYHKSIMDSGKTADILQLTQDNRWLQLQLMCLAQINPKDGTNQQRWGAWYTYPESKAVTGFQV